MKILIDTNVILDVLCNRKEFVDDSLKVFKYCEANQITGCISALSVPNIGYIMRKELDGEKVKEILTTSIGLRHESKGELYCDTKYQGLQKQYRSCNQTVRTI